MNAYWPIDIWHSLNVVMEQDCTKNITYALKLMNSLIKPSMYIRLKTH